MTTTAAALLLALLAGAEPAGATSPSFAGMAEGADDGRFASLLGAESLRGGSAAQAWAGFASLGVGYGQGVTTQDDLGATLDFDWSATELVLGAFWRRPLGTISGWQMAGRLSVGWYLDFGGTWIHDDNRADRGVQLAPALLLSTRAGDGLVSLSGELPLTFTTWRDGGFLIGPKVSAAYEAPLYDALTLGLRGAVSWRGGGGGAPMRGGRVEPELLIVLGYRVF
jgi:hypothetical protein